MTPESVKDPALRNLLRKMQEAQRAQDARIKTLEAKTKALEIKVAKNVG